MCLPPFLLHSTLHVIIDVFDVLFCDLFIKYYLNISTDESWISRLLQTAIECNVPNVRRSICHLMMTMTFLSVWLYIPGGHALRAGPAQSLSPLVSPSEGELAAPLSPSSGPTLDGLGPPSSTSATPSAPPPLKDNPSLAEFVPMLTQGWAEIFIRRPSGMHTTRNTSRWIPSL